MTVNPAVIVAHLTTITAPAVDAAGRTLAARLAYAPPRFAGLVIGAARTIEAVDLYAVAAHLAEQRTQAAAGRPRGEHSGGHGGGVSRPTEAVGVELDRIRCAGLEIAEAIDRLFPDPAWPALASGWRWRMQTAVEATETAARAAWDTEHPAGVAWDDLSDSVGILADGAREVRRLAVRALRIRAWHGDPADEVAPAPVEHLCSGRMKSEACGQVVAPHRHPETGTVHLADVCDDCYRLVCPVCWERPRRTAGAARCERCEKRQQRAA